VTEAHQAASEEQRLCERKWNNAKCDALSLYAYSTWAGPDDLFVTADKNFHKQQKKEQLLQPFHLQQLVLVPEPGSAELLKEQVVLMEQVQTITISGVIQGHILTPQQAVEYLRPRLERANDHACETAR
jgi:hypothetical protein